MSSKDVRFYCEFCGHQVKANDKICSHCGSFFSQVKCQQCGFQSDSKVFLNGCPRCGYSSPSGLTGHSGSDALSSARGGHVFVDYSPEELQGSIKSRSKKKPAVPAWVWVMLLLVLGSFFVLATFLVRTRG